MSYKNISQGMWISGLLMLFGLLSLAFMYINVEGDNRVAFSLVAVPVNIIKRHYVFTLHYRILFKVEHDVNVTFSHSLVMGDGNREIYGDNIILSPGYYYAFHPPKYLNWKIKVLDNTKNDILNHYECRYSSGYGGIAVYRSDYFLYRTDAISDYNNMGYCVIYYSIVIPIIIVVLISLISMIVLTIIFIYYYRDQCLKDDKIRFEKNDIRRALLAEKKERKNKMIEYEVQRRMEETSLIQNV